MKNQAVHVTAIPVRWSDLDADGRVNNVVILRFAEEARMQWAEALRTSVHSPELVPVVAKVSCTYHAPIGYPAIVRVAVHCTRVGRSSVDLLFEMTEAGSGLHFATANTVWVWIDRASQRPAPAPECLREAVAG